MLYSPKPHREYIRHGRGPGVGLRLLPEAYWNLAWLTLPGVDEVAPEQWVKHPIEDAIPQYVWTDLRDALQHGYPLEAVQVIIDEGVDVLTLCQSWELDTFDTMMARAREAETRLRLADGTLVVPDNVIRVDFNRRKRRA